MVDPQAPPAKGGRRVGGRRPPVRSPIHFSIRPPDDALEEEGTFGHRRLLHARAGGDGSTAATTATTRSGTTTAAGTGHAPNATEPRPGSGSKSVKPSCCRCSYFHAVVTVPSELSSAFRRNQKLLYGMLMQVSAAAVKDLCAEKRHLGALPGMLSVLHTWNGQLGYHPHVHLLITGGGITAGWPALGAGSAGVPRAGRCPFPQDRRAFCAALKAAAPAVFAAIPGNVWGRKWVSFCKHYGHGNDAVLTYRRGMLFARPSATHGFSAWTKPM